MSLGHSTRDFRVLMDLKIRYSTTYIPIRYPNRSVELHTEEYIQLTVSKVVFSNTLD